MSAYSLYDFLSITPPAQETGDPTSGTYPIAPPAANAEPVFDAEMASYRDPGLFFFNLTQLARQNPDDFRVVARQVTVTLRKAALRHADGGPQGRFLGNLADTFHHATKTGVLRVPSGPFSRQFVAWWRDAMRDETFETIWGASASE